MGLLVLIGAAIALYLIALAFMWISNAALLSKLQSTDTADWDRAAAQLRNHRQSIEQLVERLEIPPPRQGGGNE
jgi:hypothetical protein